MRTICSTAKPLIDLALSCTQDYGNVFNQQIANTVSKNPVTQTVTGESIVSNPAPDNLQPGKMLLQLEIPKHKDPEGTLHPMPSLDLNMLSAFATM